MGRVARLELDWRTYGYYGFGTAAAAATTTTTMMMTTTSIAS
jgi:hypothetical protein